MVTLTDADWMTPLWNESALDYKKWWPVKVPTTFTVPNVQAMLDVSANAPSRQRIHTDPLHRGFFVCRPGVLPEAEVIGMELVLWIARRGLPATEYRELLRGLFTTWFTDELARGEYEWAYGSMPETMPAGDRAYLEDWVKAGGVEVTEYVERGIPWRRYYGRVKTCLERLP